MDIFKREFGFASDEVTDGPDYGFEELLLFMGL